VGQAAPPTWANIRFKNRDGENNCFLNVALQTLFRLVSFRGPLGELGKPAYEATDLGKVLGKMWSEWQNATRSIEDFFSSKVEVDVGDSEAI